MSSYSFRLTITEDKVEMDLPGYGRCKSDRETFDLLDVANARRRMKDVADGDFHSLSTCRKAIGAIPSGFRSLAWRIMAADVMDADMVRRYYSS